MATSSNIDPKRIHQCKKCIAAGIDPPFEGTPGAIGSHSRRAHPAGDAAAAVRDATAAALADAPPDALGPVEEGGAYVRDDERVPGGVTVLDGDAPKPGIGARLRARVWGAAEEQPSAEARRGVPVSSRERRPAKSSRSSTAPVFEMVWRWAGTRLERTNIDPAVGRALVWQSALAGDAIEKATKGTWLDRLVQPFASRVDELEVLGALFGLPVMIGYLERNPQSAPLVVPMVADMLEVHLHAMVPVIRKQREKSAKAREAARELYPDLPEGADPTAHILAELFAGTVFATGFGPDELAAWAALAQEASDERNAPPMPGAAA